MVNKCGICDAGVTPSTPYLKCASCNKYIHVRCTGLKEIELNHIVNNKAAWSCLKCGDQEVAPRFREQLVGSQIITIEMIDELISKRIDNLYTQLTNSFTKRIDELERRITGLEAAGGVPNTPNYDFESVVNELDERNKRKKNVILFQVPESTSNETSDNVIIEEKLRLLEVRAVPTKISRLGNRKPNNPKPRPLRLTFSSESEAKEVLRSNAKIRDSTQQFRADRTMKQREYFAKLKSELETRQARGERDLIIRYRDDIPFIAKNTRAQANIADSKK